MKESSLILASQSPRRKRMLEAAGLVFAVVKSSADETLPIEGSLEEKACIVAERKAAEVSTKFPQACVLGADTLVCIDGRILGKPASKDEAGQMLSLLSGRTHRVCTGFCITWPAGNRTINQAVVTKVTFCKLSAADIEWYVATGLPLDKAGAYGIQGQGAFMVSRIDGSYTNVKGLPMAQVLQALMELGLLEKFRAAPPKK
ncbi:MAG: Maf family protein [Desulfatibacillaceae bacterium]|nr:Maf family protein [Desulfatibacillaceae bacterium]